MSETSISCPPGSITPFAFVSAHSTPWTTTPHVQAAARAHGSALSAGGTGRRLEQRPRGLGRRPACLVHPPGEIAGELLLGLALHVRAQPPAVVPAEVVRRQPVSQALHRRDLGDGAPGGEFEFGTFDERFVSDFSTAQPCDKVKDKPGTDKDKCKTKNKP